MPELFAQAMLALSLLVGPHMGCTAPLDKPKTSMHCWVDNPKGRQFILTPYNYTRTAPAVKNAYNRHK
jgi:hypothetical protein